MRHKAPFWEFLTILWEERDGGQILRMNLDVQDPSNDVDSREESAFRRAGGDDFCGKTENLKAQK